MASFTLQQIADWAGGILLRGEGTLPALRVCTDSRKLRAGDLFLAIKGEVFDGHEFVEKAAREGAAGAIVSRRYAALHEGDAYPPSFALIAVDDTLAGLLSLAANYRKSLALKVIGITGSSGKTSTKDFTAAVLGSRYRVVKTQGNLNNHIGLPLSLLTAQPEDEIGIFEMGMNHPGEIAPLAAMAKPDAAIITNIGVAHIEYMGSRDAIALEKGRLAEALTAEGTLIMGGADDYSASIAGRHPGKNLFVGLATHPESDSFALKATILESGFAGTRFRVESSQGERAEVHLPVPGLHMVENALLALAAGSCFGVSLTEGGAGLAECRLTKGRLEQKSLRDVHFLDDTYNANPDSMRAALKTLASFPTEKRRFAVLGKMGELGAEAEKGHRSVGQAAAEAGIDHLIVVGPEAAFIATGALEAGLASTDHVSTAEEAAALLHKLTEPGDLVLVKGSRSARMEQVLEHFTEF